MRVEIRLPEVGALPLVLSVWFAEVGDPIYEGDRLVEVLANGATFDVSAPATGWLADKQALPDDVLLPGQVLGTLVVDEQTIFNSQ
jgi:pyruvate/2-oxoglutarate dehydrogenase complex dihydrolipoamide acyltransferase (E2) component